jgi:hypothetical protein
MMPPRRTGAWSGPGGSLVGTNWIGAREWPPGLPEGKALAGSAGVWLAASFGGSEPDAAAAATWLLSPFAICASPVYRIPSRPCSTLTASATSWAHSPRGFLGCGKRLAHARRVLAAR